MFFGVCFESLNTPSVKASSTLEFSVPHELGNSSRSRRSSYFRPPIVSFIRVIWLLLHLILVLTGTRTIRYLDSILEHGAMVIQDTVVLRPLVLNSLGTIPAHVGCVINDKQWEFRSATTNTFENGNVQLDGVHARGSFLRHNPRLNHPLLDLKAKLALSHNRISGEEFYKAIPSAYGYRDYFSTCIQIPASPRGVRRKQLGWIWISHRAGDSNGYQ
jgi:hypothetical protein